MVSLNAPVMTVTDVNGMYEIALEEETCVMLQQHQREQQEKLGNDKKDDKMEGEVELVFRILLLGTHENDLH